MTPHRLPILVLLILGLAPSAFAQAFLTWNGTGSDWNNTSRWVGWASSNATSFPYGQLQWTGSGQTTSTNNFSPGAAAWRLFFDGNTAYTITGNEIGLTDFGGGLGGIMSRASGNQTIQAPLNFRDAGARDMFITTRTGGSGAGGGGGALTVSNITISANVTALRLAGEPGAGRIRIIGAISEFDGAKSIVIGRDQDNAEQSSTVVELLGNSTSTGPVLISSGTLAGIGTLASRLHGGGLLEPGISGPGIFSADSLNPRAGLALALEFTASTPNLGSRNASANDILHLTGATPFAAPLEASNTLRVFLNRPALALGETFAGGFLTSQSADFASQLTRARTIVYIRGNGQGTDAFHNGQGYFLLSQWNPALSVRWETVASGESRIARLAVVDGPAPSTLAAQATDRASNYSSSPTGSGAWQNDTNRAETLFGVWQLATANGGTAGHFIGDSSISAANINSDGKSFGMYAHPSVNPAPTATAVRKFAQPVLRTGDSISFRVAVNYRNGNKGFSLRGADGIGLWNFNVGKTDTINDGYYIRNGPSATTTHDNGQRLGGYHANTVFTFTFTQFPRRLDWTVQRSGGITSSVSGSLETPSGTVADVRFNISGTETGTTSALLAANNLYVNDITFSSERRGDSPLTLGERRYPGFIPSHTLRFFDPVASTVAVLASADNFTANHALAKNLDGFWEIDIRQLELAPGHHRFKFRIDGQLESGDDRRLFLDPLGRLAMPRAVYLEWTGDPTTTMGVRWHNEDPAATGLRWRPAGSTSPWNQLGGSTTPFPFSERLVHSAEITGLLPAAEYEFQVDGYEETFRFRTMPSTLANPVTFGIGGDVDISDTADSMTAAIAARNPDFLAVIGDLTYDDGKAENFWRWYRYFDSWFANARTPDGRLIPMVVGIGNHEVRYGFTQYHPDFENTSEWRLRQAPYFYRCFSFPGLNGHGVLDFGDYLSLIVLDTDHSNLVANQTAWLSTVLDARRDRPHLIPAYHVPAYPTSSFRPFSYEFSARVRQHWVPLFEQAGVQLVFENHDHTFSRTKPLLGGVENANGIRYLGDGLWGTTSRLPDASRSYLEITNEKHHVHLVTLTSTGRSVEAVDAQGNFFGGRITQPVDGIPAAPAPAISSLSRNAISLQWIPVSRATNYKVIRSDGANWFTSSTSFNDTAWTPASGFSYVVEAVNRSGHSRNHPDTAPRPRQLWRLANNLPWDGSGNGSDFADPDGNGLVNLQEYFFGIAPGSRDTARAASPYLDPVTNRFGIRYRKNPDASDTSLRVLRKFDLADPAATWTPVSILDEFEQTQAGTEIRRATIPLDPNTPKTFLKLEVVPAP